MTTILLLGGYGATGKSLARHLLARTNANVILAGRNFDKAKSFADELNDARVTPLRVDEARRVRNPQIRLRRGRGTENLLLDVLRGTARPARKPGLWMMGHLAEPVRLMQDMNAMGAKIETIVE